ncbi:MAG: hypothetical protein EBS73_16335, partial [Betaproteobacteria bacterium]|nr:hypothetical protein [Betaproteobacteria bacterium]
YGWSMGAQQAYHWAAAFPDQVDRIIAICGSAKTSVHNKVFLQGLLAVLEAAPEYLGGGQFSAEPINTKRAFARIYAGWALSQDYYRAGLHLSVEKDLENFLNNQWDKRWALRRAANLYAQALCWLAADISNTPSIKAISQEHFKRSRQKYYSCRARPTSILGWPITKPNSSIFDMPCCALRSGLAKLNRFDRCYCRPGF